MTFRFSAISRECSRTLRFAVLLLLPAVFSASCASAGLERRFTELLQRYPATDKPLGIRKLSGAAIVPHAAPGKPVTIIVHPGYSLFFREERKSTYTEAKYGLLEHQLSTEARFISDMAGRGELMILVLPGDYEKFSIAPRSYIAYLNTLTAGSRTVLYVFSETWHEGSLPVETTVELHTFLRNLRAEKVLVGGGYIGRCQKEFHSQLTNYVGTISTFIVPEISSISPDDVSSREAANILANLRRNDYALVEDFIDRKNHGMVEILPLPNDFLR